MPYATTAQMIERFTEREVIAITDLANTGLVNEPRLQGALVGASAEIDGYLACRYALPLAVGGVPVVAVPQLLVGLCCDIARYRLTGTEVQETEAIRNRYKDALKTLQLIAGGDVLFAESPDLVASGNPNAGGASIQGNQRDRLFGPGCLGGY